MTGQVRANSDDGQLLERGGVGLIDICTCSMTLGAKQNIDGQGLLIAPDEAERRCTANKLITTAIGSGPLYDITIDGNVDEKHKIFFNGEYNVEAIIDYERQLEKPEILDASLGEESFWFSPSLYKPNYKKLGQAGKHEIVSAGPNIKILDAKFMWMESNDTLRLVVLEEVNRQPRIRILKPTNGGWQELYRLHPALTVGIFGGETYNSRYNYPQIKIANDLILYSGPMVDRAGAYHDTGYVLYRYNLQDNLYQQIETFDDIISNIRRTHDLDRNATFGGGFDVIRGSSQGTHYIAIGERTWAGGQYPKFRGRVKIIGVPANEIDVAQVYSEIKSTSFTSFDGLNAFGEKVELFTKPGSGRIRLAVLEIDQPGSTEHCIPKINIYSQLQNPELIRTLTSFRFDPLESRGFSGLEKGDIGYKQEPWTPAFDLSADGITVAFSAIDPIGDTDIGGQDLRSGKVQVFRKEDPSTDWSDATIITTDVEPDEHGNPFNNVNEIDDIGFGRSIKIVKDKLLVTQNKSVSIYQYRDTNPSIGQGSSSIIIGDDDIVGLDADELILDPIDIEPIEELQALGTISFSSSVYRCNESDPFVEVVILRESGASGKVSVDYRTQSGTAIAGKDFTDTSGSVIFEEGETSKNIRVPIINDSEFEGDENFTIILSNARYVQDAAPIYFVVGDTPSEPTWEKLVQVDNAHAPPKIGWTFGGFGLDLSRRDHTYQFPIVASDLIESRTGNTSNINYRLSTVKSNYVLSSQDVDEEDYEGQISVFDIPAKPSYNSDLGRYEYTIDPLCRFDKDIFDSTYIDWKGGYITRQNEQLDSIASIDTISMQGYRHICWPLDQRYQELFAAYDQDLTKEFSISFFVHGRHTGDFSYPICSLGDFKIVISNLLNKAYVYIPTVNGVLTNEFSLNPIEPPDGYGGTQIKSDLNYDSYWNHYAVTINATLENPTLKFYQNGSLVGERTIRSTMLEQGSKVLRFFSGYFGNNLSIASRGIDDIRVFNREITRREAGRLASHRVKAILLDEYIYEFLGETNGIYSLEYKSSTWKDVPISDFCQLENVEKCGPLPRCIIDAEIRFCYNTNFPNATPVYEIGGNFFGGSGYLETNSPPHVSQIFSESRNMDGIARFFNAGIFGYTIVQNLQGEAELKTGHVDKYNGEFFDLSCSQILYPSGDVDRSDFISSLGVNSPTYLTIEEGVYEGDWKTDSTLLSDDLGSYIQLISPDTKGEFSYKVGMTNTLYDPEESIIKFRMSAPTFTFDSQLPPRYEITNIKYEDPQGILITQYEDIDFIGDSNFVNDVNYTTVVRPPIVNKIKGRYKWNDDYPNLGSGTSFVGFTLSFDVKAYDQGGEFTYGFSEDFTEDLTREASSFLNPSLRISAIEICTSGRPSTYDEAFINLLTPVVDTGRRLEKCFYPTFFPKYDFDTGVWPSVSSIWSTNGLTNESTLGTIELLSNVRDIEDTSYITLDSMGPVENSGKLTIRFGYDVATQKQLQAGSFSDAFGEGRNKRDNIWFSPPGAFAGLTTNIDDIDLNFFEFDSILLKVRAKKAVGSRDYSLDVVGYSDDCLLHVTPAVGGFLQNVSGVYLPDHTTDTLVFYGNDGSIPTTSGFKGVDDLGLSSEPFSNRDEYYETDKTNNAGGDHYLLSTYPVVSSTEFEWYEIPLKAYEDNVDIGRSKKYNMSSLLERLYLDIYPLPTGASISNIQLCVRYAPQNALTLSTEGGAGKISRDRSRFYPTARQSSDTIINAGSGYAPISLIEDIPHAFKHPTTLKSNYSRRWRGIEGTVNGPFDVDQFNLGFENPLVDYPFVSGFYLFNEKSTTIQPIVGDLTGTLSTTYTDYHFTNIGWRFSNTQLFEDRWPGFSTNYTTTDWTALENGVENFQNHELYGQISDAFSNAIRISGHNSYINFGDVNTGTQGENGFSVYVRFTPDANISGVGYNLFDSGVLVSKWDSGQDMEFSLAYSGGYLVARAKDAITSTIKEAYDTVPYSGYQFPLSVIMTYNDHNSNRLKLYTDNEFESDWNVLRSTSDPLYLSVNTSELRVGHSPGSGVGFNMFLFEFGFSDGNIVESNPDLTHQEVTAQKFLENHRMYWWDQGDETSTDAYKLWSYLDEDTYLDWRLGEFNSCQFNQAFDNLNSTRGRRGGRDLIKFEMNHHGSGYSQYATLDMPSTVNSGVSYHTQIENDFLRFNLSDAEENFYAVRPRISKNLPFGYSFEEKALYVSTILEHKSDSHNILWEDGNIGPKFIVSLYTRTKEPLYPTVEPFTEDNWGLINRSIHYLPPSGCITRLESKFTYDDYCNDSEGWAIFPNEPRTSEFTEKYFSTDIDDMFLQYDLVYPSGPRFDSRIEVHSCDIRTENSFVKSLVDSGTMLLYTSGNPSPVVNNLEMVLLSASGMEEIGWNSASGLNLFGSAPRQLEDTGFILFTSGQTFSTSQLNSFIHGHEFLGSPSLNLIASGDGRTWTPFPPPPVGGMFIGEDLVVGAEPTLPPLPMYVFGKGLESGILPLAIGEVESSINSDGPTLPLYTFAASGASGVQNNMPIFLLQNFKNNRGADSGVLDLLMFGSLRLSSRYRTATTNLSLLGPDPPPPAEKMNLSLRGPSIDEFVSTDNMNLFLLNYGFNIPYFLWYNNRYGVDITIQDNYIASIPVDDEIRGVDLFGYGSCTGDSPKKAIDPAVIVDDIVWRPEVCEEGGIFRATATYTNTEIGYSGHYYGIRKFENLVPNGAYATTLTIKTGDTHPLPQPNEWVEWEYGTCGPDTIGDCCPDDACTRNINFSGIKLIGDYPYKDGDSSLHDPSGRMSGDNYGHCVSVEDDLMAVGAPNHSFYDERGDLAINAGAVYLYRRNEDIPGLKADWELEEKLLLPSGFRQDYITGRYSEMVCYLNNEGVKEFCVSGQQWNVGQKGREFGHTVDICNSGDREVVVVGAPGAKWDREFEDITVSGIPIFMVLFTDRFSYNKDKVAAIGNAAAKYDILYKYFSAPWDLNGGNFQSRLDINVLVCEVFDEQEKDKLPKVRSDKPWFKHLYINNLLEGGEELLNSISSGIQNKFFEMFPYQNALYSGIPPIVGIFGDDSPSTFNTATYKSAVDRFINFYQSYAYTSGVADYTDDTPQSGYIKQIYAEARDWDKATIELLVDTLETGNLLSAKQQRFPTYKSGGNPVLNYVTSGVGVKWARDNSYEFQIPPESGGRVYIFEKEDTQFNLVQEIVSPEENIQGFDSNDFLNLPGGLALPFRPKYNDRFGHSVSISDNSEVIAIGSPYSIEPCLVYERNESENARMYSRLLDWLQYSNKTAEINRFSELLSASGRLDVQKQIYKELSPTDKFLLRSDRNFWGLTPINLYQQIFKYDYADIPYTGTWSFIPKETASTSRLGYSTAVNEDGSVAVFGAPTDSLNEFDDFNVYYRTENTWASYMQAGAARVFESRKYYPHSGAVEFTRFGNLDRSIHATGDMIKYYDSMGDYLKPKDVYYERLPFSEIEIPKDAGLAFVITPEIDAASDEIVDNLKSWLALGDRTLVLVGNDPTYEEDGIYQESNEILNNLLEKLGSRMKLVPARTEYESMVAGVTEQDYADDKYNVTPSPYIEYSHDTHLRGVNMFASGVADIRIDLSDLGLQDLKLYSPCNDKNPKCEHTIQHMGDLRAQWESACIIVGDPPAKVEYKTNWPFHFNNPNPAQTCSFFPTFPKPYVNRPGEDIRPILSAAEFYQPPPRIIPADSGVKKECTTEFSGILTTKYTTGSKLYEFAENNIDTLAFSVVQSGTLLSGIYEDIERGTFFDPEPFKTRNAFLQAAGTSYEVPVPPENVKVADESVWATEESIFAGSQDTNSKVIIFSSPMAETAFALGKGDLSENPNNEDQNIYFFNNLVMKDCNSAGNIVQLGGWTGRNSFKEAFEDSVVAGVLKMAGNTVSSGVVYSGSDTISVIHNVVWIANPIGKPAEEDVQRIKNWLLTGDKKLIITYYNDQEIAENIDYICDALGLNTKPFYSQAKGAYHVQDTDLIMEGNKEKIPYPTDDPDFEPKQIIDPTSTVFQGCKKGYAFNPITSDTKVEKLAIIPENTNPKTFEADYDMDSGYSYYGFIPLKVGNRTKELVKYKAPLYEKRFNNPNIFWKIKANANMDFPVVPDSGYRVFVNYVSESPEEKYDITLDIDGASFSPYPGDRDEAGDGSLDDGDKKIEKTDTYKPRTKVYDVRVKEGATTLSIRLNTDEWVDIKNEDFNGARPLTPRILSVSGCPLPIDIETVITTRFKDRKIFITKCTETPWFKPEEIITQPSQFREISTINTKYCYPEGTGCDNHGGQFIGDGPVIAAEELEHFTTFGVGRNRSRIVLLSDSTMIQGQSPHIRRDALDENQRFIRSLYPPSPHLIGDQSSSEGPLLGERKFRFAQKIIAPQRGSVMKYYAASGLDGLRYWYSLQGISPTGNLNNFTDQENINPDTVERPFSPPTPEEQDLALERFGIDVIGPLGVYPRYSGIIDGELLIDRGIEGGMPPFLLSKGKDYIHPDMLVSGYAGDLFGYSLDIHGDKLVVGTPFNAFLGENIPSWASITNLYDSGGIGSGLDVCNNGGAGAVFYYERTGRGKNAVTDFLPWEYKQKIKPDELHVGIDDATLAILEERRAHETLNLTSDFVAKNAVIPDRFGYSVAIEADFLAVGAPAHDFETIHEHIYSGHAGFIRKEFNGEFNIPQHKFYDMGTSGVRIDDFNRESGKFVLNNGAVFTYRHEMVDWSNRRKEWTYAQKMNAEGYGDRNNVDPTGCENDFFGFSVALDRPMRGDSNYVLVAGAPNHNYPTSGEHITQNLEDAGASYTFDAMLREQLDVLPNSGSYIDAQVFGAKPDYQSDRLRSVVNQNVSGDSLTVRVTGIVFADNYGHLFLEVSGQDPAQKGFIAHRPYVESIEGRFIQGTPVDDSFILITSGTPNIPSGQSMSLLIPGPSSDIVYNNMSFYTSGSYVDNSNIPLYLQTYSGAATDYLNLSVATTQTTGNLNLRIRGK